MLDKLKQINEKLIILYQNDEKNLKKQLIIKKLLEEENCFFKIDIETSYSILKDLNIPDDELRKVYQELIDIDNLKKPTE